MHACVIKVFDEGGTVRHTAPLQLAERPHRLHLDGIQREHINGVDCRFAAVWDDQRIRALYLPEATVPELAVRTSPRRRVPGRWATSALRLGGPGFDRALVGPELFFRQVDLAVADAWMAPLLMRFCSDIPLTEHRLGRDVVRGWVVGEQRYYYATKGSKWTVYGAGNLSQEAVDTVLAEAKPDSAVAFLTAVGAVSLA